MTLVGLGDSYAAGVGGADHQGACWRSDRAYPVQVAKSLGMGVRLEAACLGATIADVVGSQLAGLDTRAEVVTITVGGNDAGFVPVIVACAAPAWVIDSESVIDHADALIAQTLPGRLDSLYADVRTAAANARVLVAGYPLLFDGDDCELLTFFTPHEMARLNATGAALNAAIAAAAGRAGFEFVDVRGEFTGHAICDPVEWVHGVSWPVEESFHPAPAGHDAYARAVLTAYGKPQQVELPAPIRVTHGADCRGSAPVFSIAQLLPDLRSAKHLAAAVEHGLDPAEVADLATRSGAHDQAARARLRELDQDVRARRNRRQ